MKKQNEPYYNSEYWEDRIANETWKTYNDIEEKNMDLLRMYEKSSQNIKNELLALAEKAERDGGLGRSDQYRFNKLLGEQGEIFKECERLGEQIEKHATNHMIAGGKATYKNVMEALGETQFHMPNKKVMEQMLRSPWRGSFFSERLWRDMGKLERNLNGVISNGISTGKTITEMAVQLSNIMQSSFNDAHRLVRTETINYLNRSELLAYKNAGVGKVQWWAAQDERTCPTCGANHEKTYPIDKTPNLPCHPGCRCTWLPIIEDIDETELTSERLEDIIKVEDAQTFSELRSYMEGTYSMVIDQSVDLLDFESVKEGAQGIEYVIKEFPQAKTSFKGIGTNKNGLMCAGYDGVINFNPNYYKTRKMALYSHGIGEGIRPSGMHPNGNNCFGSGAHEAGHILEKAIVDKINGGESPLGEIQWIDMTVTKAIVSDACKIAKKLPECRGMRNNELKNQISKYAGEKSNYSASETLAEAVCDCALNGDKASPLSKEIWKILKKELG